MDIISYYYCGSILCEPLLRFVPHHAVRKPDQVRERRHNYCILHSACHATNMSENQPLLHAERKKTSRRTSGNVHTVGSAVSCHPDTAGEERTGKRNHAVDVTVFPPSDTDNRNVVILGKMGTGKRTLANHIVDEPIFTEPIFTEPNRHSDNKVHYGEKWTQNMLYRILIVHTGGLQTDPLIQHIRQHFERIHLIILVTRIGRFTSKNCRSLVCAVESLRRRANCLCALVITHCDDLTDEALKNIVIEFQGVCHRDAPKVEAFVGNSIYTVGFRSVSSNKQLCQQRIAKDEKAIRQLVKSSEHSLSVQDALILPNFCSRFKASIKSRCSCIFPITD